MYRESSQKNVIKLCIVKSGLTIYVNQIEVKFVHSSHNGKVFLNCIADLNFGY